MKFNIKKIVLEYKEINMDANHKKPNKVDDTMENSKKHQKKTKTYVPTSSPTQLNHHHPSSTPTISHTGHHNHHTLTPTISPTVHHNHHTLTPTIVPTSHLHTKRPTSKKKLKDDIPEPSEAPQTSFKDDVPEPSEAPQTSFKDDVPEPSIAPSESVFRDEPEPIPYPPMNSSLLWLSDPEPAPVPPPVNESMIYSQSMLAERSYHDSEVQISSNHYFFFGTLALMSIGLIAFMKRKRFLYQPIPSADEFGFQI